MPAIGNGSEIEITDLALIRRVVGGDETALAVLYSRYAGMVYSVAKRILGETGAAEEVAQDIFYQLWRTASRFDLARGSLGGWLLVAARNRSIDRLRRRQSRGQPEKHGDEPGIDQVALNLNVETSVARKEMISQVRGALDRLPEEQRKALELAYFEGLTHSEIATRTGDPLGTVKTRLRTALESLRQALNP